VAMELLRAAGIEVTVANNGREAVKAVKESHYEAVLMDIQMPEMNGFEATEEIRKSNRFKNLPIIAMTAHAMTGDRERSLDAGMNDHVTKPIDPEILFSTLAKWVGPEKQEVAREERTKKEESEEIPSHLPGISVKAGLARVAGNSKLYRRLLGRFGNETQEVDQEIRQAIQLGDQEQALALVHSVKGVAGNLGADELSQEAAHLEKSLKGRDLKSSESALKAFGERLKEVIDSIGRLETTAMDSTDSYVASASEIDRPAVEKLLREMLEYLETNLSEVFKRLDALEGLLKSSPARKELRNLQNHLDLFELDNVRVDLENISQRMDIIL